MLGMGYVVGAQGINLRYHIHKATFLVNCGIQEFNVIQRAFDSLQEVYEVVVISFKTPSCTLTEQCMLNP
jgi:hypothetical protein